MSIDLFQKQMHVIKIHAQIYQLLRGASFQNAHLTLEDLLATIIIMW